MSNWFTAWLERRREAKKPMWQRKRERIQRDYPRAWVNENWEPRYRNDADRYADEKHRLGRDNPETPTNVRLVHRETGDVIPVELTYHGRDLDGMHDWAATAAVAGHPLDYAIRADQIPAKTCIRLELRRNP